MRWVYTFRVKHNHPPMRLSALKWGAILLQEKSPRLEDLLLSVFLFFTQILTTYFAMVG